MARDPSAERGAEPKRVAVALGTAELIFSVVPLDGAKIGPGMEASVRRFFTPNLTGQRKAGIVPAG